jgi:sulfate transport system permease protein
MGEFGAVSVISGHIPGMTETMPLHIETLYNSYQSVAAFSMAALLAMMAMGTVGVRALLEARSHSTSGVVSDLT